MRALREISFKDSDRRAVELVAAALRSRFPVERILLFGSKARGDADPESDLDLLVLTSRPMTPAEKREMRRLLFRFELDLGVILSGLVVPVEEWERGLYQVMPIRAEIDRDGVFL